MPARRRAYHHGDLRAALLREAERVLRKEGIEALSLREVARRMGVSEAAPYHHFKSRTALLAAVAAEGFEKLWVALSAEKHPDPRKRLAAVGAAYVRFAVTEPGAYRAMFGAHVVDLGLQQMPEVYDVGHPSRVLLFDLCMEVAKASGQKRINGKKLFAASWALVHGIAWLHVEKEFPDVVASDKAASELARQSLELLLEPLEPRKKR